MYGPCGHGTVRVRCGCGRHATAKGGVEAGATPAGSGPPYGSAPTSPVPEGSAAGRTCKRNQRCCPESIARRGRGIHPAVGEIPTDRVKSAGWPGEGRTPSARRTPRGCTSIRGPGSGSRGRCRGHPAVGGVPNEEARTDLAATSRRAVPMREILGVAADFAHRMGPADPGFLGEVESSPRKPSVFRFPGRLPLPLPGGCAVPAP